MGALKASKNQALLVGETMNAKEKKNRKGKDNMNTKFKPKEYFDSSDGAFISKKDKH